jgi:hypothetical protein
MVRVEHITSAAPVNRGCRKNLKLSRGLSLFSALVFAVVGDLSEDSLAVGVVNEELRHAARVAGWGCSSKA